MTTVTGNITDLIGRPAIGASIRFVLVHNVEDQPIPLPAVNDGRIYGTADAVVHVASDGSFAVALDDNAGIDYPGGTYYQALIMTPTSWDNLARTRANRVERQIDFVVPPGEPVDLSDTSLWVVSPVPPEWAPLVGPQGPPGEDGDDMVYGTLPQTTLLTESGGYHYTVPGFSPIAAATSLALAPNTIYYEPFELWDESYWPNIVCEVTTPSPNQRTVTDGVLNGTTTITSATANFTVLDEGRVLAATGLPTNVKIASVINSTTAVLTLPATATATGVTIGFHPLLSMAVYAVDSHWHPVDLVAAISPVLPVDAGFQNEHTREIGLVAPGGRYVKAVWTEGSPIMRTVPHGSPYGFFITGSSGIHVNRSTAFKTYTGVWDDPGLAPNTIVRSGTAGAYHTSFLLPGDS